MSNAELIKTIIEVIFKHEFKRLKLDEIKLVNQNLELGGSSDGFRYMGFVFTNLAPNLISKARFNNPNHSMKETIDRYIIDANLINFDLIRIKQALVLVLKDTKYKQDIRDALPECLIDVLPTFKDCSRVRPEAYTLLDNPRSLKQYNEIREKIEFYLASKMLY